MKRKRLLALGMAAAMTATLLGGCGGGSSSTSGTEAKTTGAATQGDTADETTGTTAAADTAAQAEGGEQEPVTLTVLAGQSTTDVGIEDMIDDALAEKYPHVTLEWECVDWGNDFQPKMQQYMQSGLPDIMIGKAQDVLTYGSQGLLAEIPSEYTDRIMEAATENVSIDGKAYGLVFNALYQGVYYNRTMFEENGWEIPKTMEELQIIIDDCKAKDIIPFASHMVDTWSIGNVTMQFAMNDVFNKNPQWGDDFRAGKESYQESADMQAAYKNNEVIYQNTFPETFSLEQTDCDAKMVLGEAAMKVSGSWSIQNFLDIDENFDFGIFPFPNQTGDAKLIFEPNITVMTKADSEHHDAINCFLDVLTGNTELATEIYDFTKTASMLKDASPTFHNPSQSDIDSYASEGNIVDVTLGNNQLVWGGFQEENAKDIGAWLQGQETFEKALQASDGRVNASSVAQ